MAISIPTQETLEAQVFAHLRNRFPGRDLGLESFLGKLAKAFVLELLGLHKSIADADNDATPSSKTSSAMLDRFAELFGLPSGVSGKYGRKPATAGTSGKAECTGTKGTAYGSGLTLTASDGVTILELDGAVTISGSAPGTGTVTGTFKAQTKGTVGNLPADSVLTWQSPPAGADTTVKLTTKISGGTDQESDADLLARIFARLQTPPKGGTSADFRAWAEAASTSVKRAYPYPLRGGLGTAHVVITGAGSGTARKPTSTVQTAVDDYINGASGQEGQRSVAAQGYKTILPYMPAYPTGSLTIRCRLQSANPKYDFDWTDTAATYTVAASDWVASPKTITLNVAAPATLQSAIAAGKKPRIQVQSTTSGASAVNPQVRVTAIDGTNTILTLENPLPAGFVQPTNGDRVFAGGPMVDTIAAALLAYVDSLGPSRAGGYADTNDSWEDVVSIARLTHICLDAADSDGARFAKNIVSGGVTIAVGNGAAAATDYPTTDTSANGPELAYARLIAVTQ